MLDDEGKQVYLFGRPMFLKSGVGPPQDIVHRGIVSITEELLVQMCHFPVGTRIVNARMSDCGRNIELAVEHEALPETEAGKRLPNVVVEYQDSDPSVRLPTITSRFLVLQVGDG